MSSYSNDQANLLLGRAATLEAYNDKPGRGTEADTRELAPGYSLALKVFAGAEVDAPVQR